MVITHMCQLFIVEGKPVDMIIMSITVQRVEKVFR